LGVPTVADRVAQTVVAGHLSERVEQVFHPDSCGYRPGKSALDAVRTCRERCWRFDWVIEFDIRKFFDTVPWDKVVAAVEAHTDARWVVLYVKRWLAAGLRLPDGSRAERAERHTAGICGVAGLGEPVPALCVRYVDGPGVSGVSVRALR
jgi:RNA-directed DNA polymerase